MARIPRLDTRGKAFHGLIASSGVCVRQDVVSVLLRAEATPSTMGVLSWWEADVAFACFHSQRINLQASQVLIPVPGRIGFGEGVCLHQVLDSIRLSMYR